MHRRLTAPRPTYPFLRGSRSDPLQPPPTGKNAPLLLLLLQLETTLFKTLAGNKLVDQQALLLLPRGLAITAAAAAGGAAAGAGSPLTLPSPISTSPMRLSSPRFGTSPLSPLSRSFDRVSLQRSCVLRCAKLCPVPCATSAVWGAQLRCAARAPRRDTAAAAAPSCLQAPGWAEDSVYTVCGGDCCLADCHRCRHLLCCVPPFTLCRPALHPHPHSSHTRRSRAVTPSPSSAAAAAAAAAAGPGAPARPGWPGQPGQYLLHELGPAVPGAQPAADAHVFVGGVPRSTPTTRCRWAASWRSPLAH